MPLRRGDGQGGPPSRQSLPRGVLTMRNPWPKAGRVWTLCGRDRRGTLGRSSGSNAEGTRRDFSEFRQATREQLFHQNEGSSRGRATIRSHGATKNHCADSSCPAHRYIPRTSCATSSLETIGPLLDGDDDVSFLVSGVHVPVGLNDLVQRITSIDHRQKLSCLDESLEK